MQQRCAHAFHCIHQAARIARTGRYIQAEVAIGNTVGDICRLARIAAYRIQHATVGIGNQRAQRQCHHQQYGAALI